MNGGYGVALLSVFQVNEKPMYARLHCEGPILSNRLLPTVESYKSWPGHLSSLFPRVVLHSAGSSRRLLPLTRSRRHGPAHDGFGSPWDSFSASVKEGG
jgi:hypothetical protein